MSIASGKLILESLEAPLPHVPKHGEGANAPSTAPKPSHDGRRLLTQQHEQRRRDRAAEEELADGPCGAGAAKLELDRRRRPTCDSSSLSIAGTLLRRRSRRMFA